MKKYERGMETKECLTVCARSVVHTQGTFTSKFVSQSNHNHVPNDLVNRVTLFYFRTNLATQADRGERGNRWLEPVFEHFETANLYPTTQILYTSENEIWETGIARRWRTRSVDS